MMSKQIETMGYLPLWLCMAGLLIVPVLILTIVPLKDCETCAWTDMRNWDPPESIWDNPCRCGGTKQVRYWDFWGMDQLSNWDVINFE